MILAITAISMMVLRDAGWPWVSTIVYGIVSTSVVCAIGGYLFITCFYFGRRLMARRTGTPIT
jgi:hypothetical protein